MPDIIFPKGKILAKRGKPTKEIHVNQKINFILKKNIMAFCFSHMLYLSLGTEVEREGKKKKKTAVTAITYMYISYVLTSGQQCISELSIKIHQFC